MRVIGILGTIFRILDRSILSGSSRRLLSRLIELDVEDVANTAVFRCCFLGFCAFAYDSALAGISTLAQPSGALAG